MEKSNIPAFPVHPNLPVGDYIGLTKREYFAAVALTGLVPQNNFNNSHSNHYEAIAINAVKYADALLTALNKKD